MSAIEQALEMHEKWNGKIETTAKAHVCLLYTSDAADD